MLTKELADLTIVYERHKIDSQRKFDEMQRKFTQSEENLFKT